MLDVVRIPIVMESGASLPNYATPGSAGMDIRSPMAFELQPLERRLVGTGLRIAVPPGYEAQIRPRSGLAMRSGVTLVNTPGTIDSDYRGEIGIIMINLGESVVQLSSGERIAQLVVAPVARVQVEIVDAIENTERGSGGFGSTGRS